ncbi:hypothetical protein GUJ93_ZPchr0001g30107 [Zizania palustris]|uniref:Fructose-1-6-bisphosphatase class I N-terminal domain-containing protein n=1 Tax=Zizania palustris TaxID=103762 RepID=A0A8J5R9P6_ZIZPA|nr:hypothetical protein GUJ93_ZPchr0001g30107 [Zizania palustris]
MDHEADAYRTDLMTITRYVLNEQSRNPEARGDLTILLSHIVLGCKFVASAVNKAGLAKLIGLAGETNVQGEEQKKLDVLSTRCSSRLSSAAAAPASSCPRRTRKLRSWNLLSVESTACALIHSMAPPTSTVASPSERSLGFT